MKLRAWMFVTAAGLLLAAGFLFSLPDYWRGMIGVTIILLCCAAVYTNK